MEQQTIPFSERKVDWIFVGFFLINFFFITYIVDIEQLIIADPANFRNPSGLLNQWSGWFTGMEIPLIRCLSRVHSGGK